jgi:hypothetical protein
MPLYSERPPLPSDDKRWRIVNGTMRKNGYSRNALIETLHTVQASFGFLDMPAIKFVAQSLRVPLSQAYGVVTFYTSSASSRRANTPAPSAPAPPATSRGPTSWWRRPKSYSISRREKPRRTAKSPSPQRAAWERAGAPRSFSSMASFPGKLRPRN